MRYYVPYILKSTVYLSNLSIGEKEYPCEFARSMFKDHYRVNDDIDDEMSENIQSLVLMAFDAEMKQFISTLDEKDPLCVLLAYWNTIS